MVREFNRRTFVKGVGVAGTVGFTAGMAGCIGDDDPIPLGSILPLSGVLEDFGPAMEQGFNLAVNEINEAGGPLGRELNPLRRDSETRPEAGVDRYEDLVATHDIPAFVGAASSGVSAPIAENVADDRVMQVSPASTSHIFTEIGWLDPDDRAPGTKYFGRTAPNDAQQGVVMAWVLDEVLEAGTVSFLYVDNPYGEGLAQVASEHFTGTTLTSVGYDEEATDFTATLDAVFADDPEAIGFVGYPGEARSIMDQWDELGYGGEWVLSEGLDSASFLADLADLLEGFHITTPDPEVTAGFEHFQQAFPGDLEGVFEAHTYDAVYIIALAMHQAGEATGDGVAQNIRDIAIGPGEQVTAGEFAEAAEILDDGGEIEYIGASSPVELNENIEALSPFAAMVIEGGTTSVIQNFPIDFFT